MVTALVGTAGKKRIAEEARKRRLEVRKAQKRAAAGKSAPKKAVSAKAAVKSAGLANRAAAKPPVKAAKKAVKKTGIQKPRVVATPAPEQASQAVATAE
jgi:hypothetical protein